MGLFTNPVALTDGTNTRTFNFRAQLPTTKAKMVAADYIETAVGKDSLLVVKHDHRTSIIRNLLQRVAFVHPAADTDTDDKKQITVNITVVAHEDFSVTEIQEEVNILVDAAGEANWLENSRAGII